MLKLSILFLLLVLLSMVCKRRLYEYMAYDANIHRYNSIGGSNLSTVVNARGACIRNVGNGPLRFSKVGFYQTTDDAQSNQRELLGQNQSTVQLYTTSIANLRGSGVEFEPSRSYVDISTVNNITLLPNTSIVIDFATDVSFRVVRLGKFMAPKRRFWNVEKHVGGTFCKHFRGTFSPNRVVGSIKSAYKMSHPHIFRRSKIFVWEP